MLAPNMRRQTCPHPIEYQDYIAIASREMKHRRILPMQERSILAEGTARGRLPLRRPRHGRACYQRNDYLGPPLVPLGRTAQAEGDCRAHGRNGATHGGIDALRASALGYLLKSDSAMLLP
jgi:hypothetical protein